ncbi:MAG: glycosyltransferase family 2 protein [Ruminococcaceae bacterium]|nr:glycosyltransferase family 2 protein [Oscillospiraceae bacterium]
MADKKTLGLVMIVKNEERCLEKCLKAVRNLVDEIYITDTGSTDRTVEIAKKFNAHISHFDWINDFAAARNFSLEQSKCDWNLVLDADEYLIEGKRKDIEKFLLGEERIGYIELLNSYKESDGEISKSKIQIPRLIPRGVKYRGAIHEQIDSELDGIILPLAFDHDGYMQEGKGERNLEFLLEELSNDENNPYILYQIAKTLWILKRFSEADNYFEKFYENAKNKKSEYRKTGIISYIYNLSELNKNDKGIKIIENEKNNLDNSADFYFACGMFYMKAVLSDVNKYINYFPEIEKSYLKCLEIGENKNSDGVIGCGSFKASYNLGVFYEVTGNSEKAREYYSLAGRQGYAPARERLKTLK